jgi:hypothetical protein
MAAIPSPAMNSRRFIDPIPNVATSFRCEHQNGRLTSIQEKIAVFHGFFLKAEKLSETQPFRAQWIVFTFQQGTASMMCC